MQFKKRIFSSLILAAFGFATSSLAGQPDTNDNGIPFIKNEISLGFFDKGFWNPNVWHPPSPFFWGATHKVDDGLWLMYQRTVFHTKRFFSVTLGGSIARWVECSEPIYAFSFVFAFHFWLIRTPSFKSYFFYSIANPTILSRHTLAGSNLGGNFIFQDSLGFGFQFGKKRALTTEIKLLHYSNGDLMARNPGFQVPVVLSIGYAF